MFKSILAYSEEDLVQFALDINISKNTHELPIESQITHAYFVGANLFLDINNGDILVFSIKNETVKYFNHEGFKRLLSIKVLKLISEVFYHYNKQQNEALKWYHPKN